MHYIVNLAAAPFDMTKMQSESSYSLLRSLPKFDSFSQMSSTVGNSSRNKLNSDSMEFDLFKRYNWKVHIYWACNIVVILIIRIILILR